MQEAFIFEGPKVRNLDFDDVIEPFGLDRRKVRKAYVTVKFLIFSSVHLEGPGVGERRGLDANPFFGGDRAQHHCEEQEPEGVIRSHVSVGLVLAVSHCGRLQSR